ncbi:PucR family transcriptional regulator [Actinocorallia populi]|uniref:PucR family transcriptional regulator n=1 Tax=Actinocorallia populi TaxID=2079200 RepID=UPI001E64C189|nr:helix-turn-helix domain-containing protein [Actinocorallia populi]
MTLTYDNQELVAEPWRNVPREEAEWMRPHLPTLLRVMVQGVQRHVPEYARPGDPVYETIVTLAVEHAMEHFVALIADPDVSWKDVHQVYFDVGYGEAVEGRSLEHLQNAMRVTSRIAWRHLSVEAGRLGKSHTLITLLAEANFAFLDELVSAASHGYARAREKAAGEREQRRGRLLSLLLVDPPATPEVLREQSALAGWPLPQRLAVVVLLPRQGGGGEGPAGLPPHLLSGHDQGALCLVVPDPDGPGRVDELAAHLAGWTGAMGPAVPVDRAATSLRWARSTLELITSGVVTGRGTRRSGFLVRAEEHFPALLLQEGGALASLVAARRLAPLTRAGEKQGLRLAVTLLECLKNGFNATGAAAALCVHPQTVRYRLGQLQEIFDFDFEDPEVRLELMLLLQVWIRAAGKGGEVSV